MVNGSFGVKLPNAKVTALVKVNNLFNKDIQQHIFGDILKRSVSSRCGSSRSVAASSRRLGVRLKADATGEHMKMPGVIEQAAGRVEKEAVRVSVPAARNCTVRILSPSSSNT